MRDPQSMSPGSIMPAYEWLLTQKLDISDTKAKIQAMKKLGVPYEDYEIENAEKYLKIQSQDIADNLAKEGIKVHSDTEIIAMIAYLQRLGTDIKKAE